MQKPAESHRVYKALLRLYPKTHREEYGEQMAQTLDDLLSEPRSMQQKAAIWLRVSRELPLNIVEEHINNLEGISMNKLKLDKRILLISGMVLVIATGIVTGLVLHNDSHFTPTTLAQVQQSGSKPTCVQSKDNTALHVSSKDMNFIGNAVATSIIDVPAGTNVNAYIKTYNGASATGSAIYAGKYGSYNFTAKRTNSHATDSYLGGWTITHFEPCKA